MGIRASVLGSILTRQYRFATRGIQITLQTARQAIDIAEDVVGDVAGRLGLHNGHDDSEVVNGVVVPEAEPRPEPPEPRPAPRAEPAPPSPASPHGDAAPTSPAARAPRPSSGRAREPSSVPPPAAEPAPPPAAEPAPPVAAEPAPPVAAEPAPPPVAEPEPAHVSSEPELVEEFSEPGAEDGAGAQVRIDEPWDGYRQLKARDVIARLPMATREELAAVELFELAGANRRSVVVAARRALKKASPPRGTTG